MAFPKTIPTSWVVRSVAAADTQLSSLKPFEFGIFDEDSHAALTANNAGKRRRVYFGVGSPNQKQFNQFSKPERLFNSNNADVTFRSEIVPTRNVDVIRYQVPKKTEKPNVYYLGYNGVQSVCESLKFECGKTYMFHVEVKGRPVRNIFPGEMREIIEFSTDCCDNCTQTSCDVGEDCHKYIDELVDKFNNGLWVSRFFTAAKVMTCATPIEGLTKTTFNKYRLIVCDNGDELALSAVQNQYSDTVTKVARNAPYTTYEIIKTGGAPTAFSQQNLIFIDECGACPSGYTAIDGGYAAIVESGDATALLADLQVIWADITSANLISTTADSSTWYVISDTQLSDSLDPADADSGKVIAQLGTVKASCQADEVTTDWALYGTCFKVQRDLCVTVGSDNCDDPVQTQSDLFDEGDAFYNNLDDVVRSTFDFGPDNDPSGCVVQFIVSQYNTEYLEEDCDTEQTPRFVPLPPFKGNAWKVCPCEGWTVDEGTGCPVPPAVDDNCCQCGIKFVGKPTTELLDTFAGYDFATYLEKEPVELTVSMYRDDEMTRICDYDMPTWLHAQRATFRQLRGDDVIKRIITERFYNQEPWVNQVNKENMLFLEREGIKLGVNIHDFYYAISIYFNEEKVQNNSASANNFNHCVTLFVNENDAATVIPQLREYLATSFQDAKFENWV